MNKINVLNLDQVAEDVYDIFRKERGDNSISYDVIRQIIEKWSIEKYPIFEKFGKKLFVESEEEVSVAMDLRGVFEEVCEAHGKKHTEKAYVEANTPEERKKRDRASLIGNIFSSLQFLNEDLIEHVVSNKAFDTIHGVEKFFREVLRYLPVEPTEQNKIKAMKQSKLTRQVFFYLKDTAGLCEIPDWYNKEDAARRRQDHKEYIENYPEAFNIALSEIIQNISYKPRKHRMILSIHPYDYVTMSYNTLGWRSCTHPEGDYAKTSLSVMQDKGTFIAYIPSETFEPNEYKVFQNNKKFRAMVHFDEGLEAMLVNKVYPSNYRSFSRVMVQTLNKTGIFGEECRILKEEEASYNHSYSESLYCDLGYNDEIIEPVSKTGEEKQYFFSIGEDVGCMICGGGLDEGREYSDWSCLSCEYGEDYGYCQRCETYHSRDEMGSDEHEFHCVDCIERDYFEYCYCNHCEAARSEADEETYEFADFRAGCDCQFCQAKSQEIEEQAKREAQRAKVLKKETAASTSTTGALNTFVDTTRFDSTATGNGVIGGISLQPSPAFARGSARLQNSEAIFAAVARITQENLEKEIIGFVNKN